jgi:hypothetical protein
MATILKNVLQFTGLAIGVPTSLPHKLNVNGIPVAPKLGGANMEGFTITADTTNVIVTRTVNAGGDAVQVYVEYWHTIEAVLPLLPPPGKLIGLTPFFFASGGASGPEVNVEDQGGAIPNNPHSTLNFVGDGVTATDAGAGVATITIPGVVTVEGQSAPIANNPHTTLNFLGGGVTTIDAGGGVANILITGEAGPQINVQDEGLAIPNNPHMTLNFVGPGVVAVDAGGGVATITIPGEAGPQINVQDEGVAIPGNPHTTLNFVGPGVLATDSGAGVARIEVSTTNLVFLPGGVAGGNIYTTWASLIAAAQSIKGYKTLQIDNSIVTPAVIPASFIAAGTGDSIAVAAGIVTLTDAAGLFTAAMVGRGIDIAASGVAANNGDFVILSVTGPTTLTYANAAAVAEAVWPGTWRAGGWDMTMCEPTAFATGATESTQVACSIAAGASFVNLRKIGGDLVLTNLNTNPASIVSVKSLAGPVLGIMTLTDAAGLFTAAMVGNPIQLAGGLAANSGFFTILSQTAATVTFTNAGGAPEAVFAGTWTVINAPIKIVGNTTLEIGQGFTGDTPTLTNNLAPLIDASQLLTNSLNIRASTAVIGGTAPSIQMGNSVGGANPALFLGLQGTARFLSGSIVGTNAAAVLQYTPQTTGQLNRLAGWAGTINNGQAGVAASAGWTRFRIAPRPLTQLAPIPSAIALTFATGLGMGAMHLYASAVNIAQTLPIIRAAAPPNNSNATSLGGVLESLGMICWFKETSGVGTVTLTPAAGETINGPTAPLASLTVAAGGVRGLMSDGISNWIVLV